MDELDRTKRITTEFGTPGGVGEKLQKLLERRAEEKDNWVSNLAMMLLNVIDNDHYYCYHFDSFLTGGVGWLILATGCQLWSIQALALATHSC